MDSVKGIVTHGHGVASGKAGDRRFPNGTIAMQIPFFKALGLDLSPYHPGTLNIDVSPYAFKPGPEALLFERVKWHSEMPAETFSFALFSPTFNFIPFDIDIFRQIANRAQT